MIKRHFILKDKSIDRLYSLGFKKTSFSDDECKFLRYSFPVHKYKGRMVLMCELTVNGKTGEVFVNIYDNNREIYVSYYNREYGNHTEFIEKINKEILREFKKLGIEEAE